MKAFLCIGFILLGVVATEGVVVDEYDDAEDVFDSSYEMVEEELPLSVNEDETLGTLHLCVSTAPLREKIRRFIIMVSLSVRMGW